MEKNDKRIDLKLRSSIDSYIDHIKKTFKEAMYSGGTWDEAAVTRFCDALRITKRGDLLTITSENQKVHSYVATKN